MENLTVLCCGESYCPLLWSILLSFVVEYLTVLCCGASYSLFFLWSILLSLWGFFGGGECLTVLLFFVECLSLLLSFWVFLEHLTVLLFSWSVLVSYCPFVFWWGFLLSFFQSWKSTSMAALPCCRWTQCALTSSSAGSFSRLSGMPGRVFWTASWWRTSSPASTSATSWWVKHLHCTFRYGNSAELNLTVKMCVSYLDVEFL